MIKKVNIKGFRTFKNLEFDLRDLNVLIGANGAGKSNFISFFSFVNSIINRKLANYSLVKGIDKLLYFGRKNTKEIEFEIVFSDFTYACVIGIKDDESFFIEKETFNELKEKKQLKYSNVSESKVFEDDYILSHFKPFSIFHFHDTGIDSGLRTPANIIDNRTLSQNGENLAAYLYYLKVKHPKNFIQIEFTFKKVAHFFEKFNLEPDKIDNSKINLIWNSRLFPNTLFNAKELSDGSLRFLALITLLMQPDLPKIIIIDEPELGLHPSAINILAGAINSAKQRKTQIILSTQSASLVSNFSANEIITVDNYNKESLLTRLNQKDIKEWLDKYSIGELWEKNIINGQNL